MFPHHVISSSHYEETVVPLQLIRSNVLMLPTAEPTEDSFDPNSYEQLYKYSMEKCEFCESIFHCRYDVIMHNAQHIIVPLINQTTYKCTTCLHVFTSKEELNHHKDTKHIVATPPKILENYLKTPTVKQNPPIPKVFLENFVRTEPVVQVKQTPPIPKLENFVRTEPVVQCDDAVTMLMKSNNLKSRLVFEDEDDDIICLDEEPPQVNGHRFNFNVNNLIINIVNNKALNGVQANKEIPQPTSLQLHAAIPQVTHTPSQLKVENFAPSIHFKHLIKPGLYGCKRCTMTFPNRYMLIIHENDHLDFKKQIRSRLCTLCDRHIAGNHHTLDAHIQRKHPDTDLSRTRLTNKCSRCKLKYHNILRHAMHYHGLFSCDMCKKHFYDEAELASHTEECKKRTRYTGMEELQQDARRNEDNDYRPYVERNCFKSDVEEIMKVCEVCALFFKDRQNFKYVCVGENSALQCNQICERCNKAAYVIKLIKCVKINMAVGNCPKQRVLSNNENRLKNIQKRLKLMNKVRRF